MSKCIPRYQELTECLCASPGVTSSLTIVSVRAPLQDQIMLHFCCTQMLMQLPRKGSVSSQSGQSFLVTWTSWSGCGKGTC
jgi:hypothetical protein